MLKTIFGYTSLDKFKERTDISNKIIDKVIKENEDISFEVLGLRFVKLEKMNEKLAETIEGGKVFELSEGLRFHCVKKIFGKNGTEVWVTDHLIPEELRTYEFRFKFFFEVFDVIKNIEQFYDKSITDENFNVRTLIISNKYKNTSTRVYCKETGVYVINIKYLHELMAGYAITKVLEGIKNNQRDFIEDYVKTANLEE